MSSSLTVEQKLNITSKNPNWFLYYGITQTRYNKLNGTGKYGVFNPCSETAKTLCFFGNLDDWQQIDTLSPTPRKLHNKNGWNSEFFENIRNGSSNLTKIKSKCDLWYNFISKNITDIKHKDFKNSILLFEFELMLDAFHEVNSEPFKKLSFLDISSFVKTKWSKFDAILILPDIKRFICFECKLDSDISRTTNDFPLINQIFRNLESVFLLTKHEDSLYSGWDFNYIFVCPKKEYEYKLTLYSYLIKDIIGNGIGLYKNLLCAEYKDKLDIDSKKYLDSFIKEAGNKISVAHWEDFPNFKS